MCRAEIFLRRRPRHLGPPVGGMPIKCSETIRAAAVAKEFLRACEALIAVPIPKISNYGRSANSTSFFPKIKWIHRFCLETRKSAKAQGCSNEALFRKYGLGGKSAGLPEKLRGRYCPAGFLSSFSGAKYFTITKSPTAAEPSDISNAAQVRCVIPRGFNMEVGVIEMSQPKNTALRSGLLKFVTMFTIATLPSLRTILPRYTSMSRSGGGLSFLARRVGDGASMFLLIETASAAGGSAAASAKTRTARAAKARAQKLPHFPRNGIFIFLRGWIS